MEEEKVVQKAAVVVARKVKEKVKAKAAAA
jgi:hypothetical protein